MDYQEMLVFLGAEDWECDPDGAVFYAPDGCAIEPDGICPHGYESPLRAAGMI